MAENEPIDPEIKAREEARQRALDRLKDVWREPDCPSCGKNEWAIGDFVDIPLRTHVKDGWALTMGELSGSGTGWRQVYVFVPVICQNCGFTNFFHSGALGA